MVGMAGKSTGTTWDTVDLAPIVLIKSKEEALTERARDRLVAQARSQDPDIEVTQIDAASYTGGELAVLASPSLFGGAKIAIVTGLETMNDDFLGDCMQLLQDPSPDLFLIAIRNGKAGRGIKLDTAIGQAGFPVVVIEEVKNPGDKIALLKADARRAKRTVAEDAYQALVDGLGSDLRELTSALRQLFDDVEGTITAKAVDTYYGGRVEAKSFAVADAAVAGNVARALELLRHALATGTAEVLIVSALAMKVRQLALVSATMGRDGASVKLSMQPWQMDRARRDLRNWSDVGLSAAIRSIAKADGDVKGFRGEARDPAYALEKCIREVTAARRL